MFAEEHDFEQFQSTEEHPQLVLLLKHLSPRFLVCIRPTGETTTIECQDNIDVVTLSDLFWDESPNGKIHVPRHENHQYADI